MPARILVIEDNPTNLDLMTYLLHAFGYRVLTASGGGEGLASACREIPELIICDIQMPGIDGYEVARQCKADPALRAVPLVAVTALAMVGDRDKALAAGFDGYIAKPIDPETFVPQVQSFLPSNRHRSARAPHEPADAVYAFDTPKVHRTVLVVDNLAANLELARSLLEPHGYVVVCADTLAEALAVAKRQPFDLILSDVCMGATSGYEFIQAVKADPDLQVIPFVFLTSTNVETRDRAQGLALGADKYLTRPIDPATLLAEIEACLRERL